VRTNVLSGYRRRRGRNERGNNIEKNPSAREKTTGEEGHYSRFDLQRFPYRRVGENQKESLSYKASQGEEVVGQINQWEPVVYLVHKKGRPPFPYFWVDGGRERNGREVNNTTERK